MPGETGPTEQRPLGLEDLGPGQHLCWLYDTAEERGWLLARYVRAGVERGDRVLLVMPGREADPLLDDLREAGLEVDALRDAGQLTELSPMDDVAEGQAFGPDQMIDLLRGAAERAGEDGFAALRVAGEMTWALEGLGPEGLVELEAKVDGLFPETGSLGLCLYHVERFEPEVLLDVIAAHRRVGVGPTLHRNVHHVAPEELLGADRKGARLRSFLQTLKRGADAEAVFHTLAEGSLQGVAVVTATGFALVNQALATMCGRPVDELLGMSADDLVARMHPDDRDRIQLGFGQIFDGKQPASVEDLRVPRPDGSTCWLQAQLSRTVHHGQPALLIVYSDITRQKLAEERLRESEERFRGLIEDSFQGAALIAGGWLVEVNDSLCALTGLDADELLAMPLADVLDLAHPDDRKRAATAVQDRLAGREVPSTQEFRFRRKDGSDRWVTTHASLVRYKGEPVVHVACRDVTGRKRADEQLRESEEKWRSILESLPDHVMKVDVSGNIAFINWTVPGVRREDLIGKSILDLVPEDYKSSAKECCKRVRESGSPDHYFTSFTFPDGITRHFEVSVGPIRKSGEMVGFAVRGADITEQKLAEAALRESEERFRSAFEHSPMGAAIVSNDLEILRPNQAFCRFLGYSAGELTGKTVAEVTHPDDLAADEGLAGQLVRDEIPSYQLEKRYIRKDGAVVWGRLSVTMVKDEQGRPLYGLPLIEDIDAHKRAEGAARASREQLRSLAVRFLSLREAERTRLSRELHDQIGQDLAGLKLDATWARSRLEEQQGVAAASKRLDEMKQVAETLLGRVQDMAAELRPSVLDSFGLMAALETEARTFAERRGIECRVVSSMEEPALTEELATGLFRIAQEALTNAAHHAEASRATIRLRAEGDKLVLEVDDDGRGIAEDEASKPGALGLLGMRERAQAYGGSLGVVGRPGEGTTVTVTVPWERPDRSVK